MKRIGWFALLFSSLFWSEPLSTEQSGSASESYRKTLGQLTYIEGYACAKGYAWFFTDNHLNRCTVAKETEFGEAVIPAGSLITLLPNERPNYVQMSRDAKVASVTCMGGGWLGTAEGASTAFYPSGKLKQCYLAGDQAVQGVPCMSGGFFGDGRGGGAVFYESGKLKSCKLTRDYGTQHKGDRFQQAP